MKKKVDPQIYSSGKKKQREEETKEERKKERKKEATETNEVVHSVGSPMPSWLMVKTASASGRQGES